MRARQYMSDVVGGQGAVLDHHVKPDDIRKKFEEAHIKDEASVQKFLQKIQADKEGYVFPYWKISFYLFNVLAQGRQF